MRIIATNTLKSFWEEHSDSEQSLKAWLQEVEHSDWKTPNALKE